MSPNINSNRELGSEIENLKQQNERSIARVRRHLKRLRMRLVEHRADATARRQRPALFLVERD